MTRLQSLLLMSYFFPLTNPSWRSCWQVNRGRGCGRRLALGPSSWRPSWPQRRRRLRTPSFTPRWQHLHSSLSSVVFISFCVHVVDTLSERRRPSYMPDGQILPLLQKTKSFAIDPVPPSLRSSRLCHPACRRRCWRLTPAWFTALVVCRSATNASAAAWPVLMVSSHLWIGSFKLPLTSGSVFVYAYPPFDVLQVSSTCTSVRPLDTIYFLSIKKIPRYTYAQGFLFN